MIERVPDGFVIKAPYAASAGSGLTLGQRWARARLEGFADAVAGKLPQQRDDGAYWVGYALGVWDRTAV